MKGVRDKPTLVSAISQRSEVESAAERRRAVRALLVRPLLCAGGDDAEDFALVRRHADYLRTFFGKHLGWTLEVDSGLARLRKVPADLSDGTRPARDVNTDIPFSRRRYVLFCLALCALERAERQTTLGRLAEEIVREAQVEVLRASGIAFDLKSQDQRRDLVQVVRLLLSLRVLVRVQGDEQQFLSERGDVLYDVERPALVALLNVRHPPSLIRETDWNDRLAALTAEPRPDTPEGRNQALRTQLMRRLIDDPVVYYRDLSEDERGYLTSQRPFLCKTLEEATGLVPEVRAEGLLLCDDRGDATDLGLPEEGTRGHLTLLLAEYLASRLRAQGELPIPLPDAVRHVEQLIVQHQSHWNREVTQPGVASALCTETLERLEALRLVRCTAGEVTPRPAIARYALVAPVQKSRKANESFAFTGDS
jgi:uncharacterized protein (TIGR02678 family)